jgi:hypothetical protein
MPSMKQISLLAATTPSSPADEAGLELAAGADDGTAVCDMAPRAMDGAGRVRSRCSLTSRRGSGRKRAGRD